MNPRDALDRLPATMEARAAWLKNRGGLERAIKLGLPDEPVAMPLAEALVLGLMRQGVTKYLAIFGHGSTAVAEVLRVYEAHALVRCWQFRNEVAMAHAGTALRWIHGETCAVVTSIGPGALQAMAGSLAASSNGVGVYHLYGDETTHGEGYNMQQVPKPDQGLFGRITALMGASFTLHSPGALREALRKGAMTVFHPWRAGPFYLNLPLNTQPQETTLRLDALPVVPAFAPTVPADHELFSRAAALVAHAERVAVKAGGGSRPFATQLRAFAEAAGAAVVLSPGSTGVMPDAHPQNVHVGGSKGSISGNFAMREAELLVMVGSRGVCQSDCSGIGWPAVRHVVNINADPFDVQHYNRTVALCGDAGAILTRLTEVLRRKHPEMLPGKREWLEGCRRKKNEWREFKGARLGAERPVDTVWQRQVLTQPQAIAVAAAFCKRVDAVKLFDAGDVQANGFQIVEDDRPGEDLHRGGRVVHGVRGLRADGERDCRARTLLRRVHRRRFVHDEPAGARRRRGARRSRDHRGVRQPPHGGDQRPAGGAVRRGLPHLGFRPGGLRTARERRARRAGALRRNRQRFAQGHAGEGTRTSRTQPGACSGLPR